MPERNESEITSLMEMSARIGKDPLLTQASTGNTSVKIDGVLWIKASGTWLAHAKQNNAFIPLALKEVRERMRLNGNVFPEYLSRSGAVLRASVETPMHAVLPQAVVVHVHSVNATAWAVRRDGAARLRDRLAGLRWEWIRYVPSGLPLAWEIEKQLWSCPKTDVFLLANHGLVVCGESCESAEALLEEVERRLAAVPRGVPETNLPLLASIAEYSNLRVPPDDPLHALATDPISRKIHSGGILHPCQALFLGPGETKRRLGASSDDERREEAAPFSIVNQCGVLINPRITRAEYAVLMGLVEVIQRLDESAPVRYLMEHEIENVLAEGGEQYRKAVGKNQNRASMSA